MLVYKMLRVIKVILQAGMLVILMLVYKKLRVIKVILQASMLVILILVHKKFLIEWKTSENLFIMDIQGKDGEDIADLIIQGKAPDLFDKQEEPSGFDADFEAINKMIDEWE